MTRFRRSERSEVVVAKLLGSPATDATLVRLVTSFATTVDEVDRFVTIVRA